jgi:hypothetical protein
MLEVDAERWEAVRWVRRSAEGESIAVLGKRESVGMEVVGGLPCFERRAVKSVE